MFEILYKYFIIHRKAVLPGIGVFHIHRQPASFDFSNKTFIAPSGEIAFKQNDVAADKTFYSFVSKEQQLNEAEAANIFATFIERLKQNLQANGAADVPGFGLLSRGTAGALQFKPLAPVPSFFKNLAAERTIREVTDEEIAGLATKRKSKEAGEVASAETQQRAAKKSYWWIGAIILALIAIAAIAYYYYQNGSFD